MPFGLTNTPASFQSYIHGVLRKYLDIFVIVFLDDILIYSREESQHEQHVRTVLEALLTAGLFMKLSKCLFSVKRMPFLGYVITNTRVEMEMDRISSIVNWPEPESVCEVQTFLGFVNFYQRFIEGFSCIAAPLTEATKGSNTKLKKELIS